MADIKDVSDVIQSALDEIGLDGYLGVEMDGEEAMLVLGQDRGQDVEVVVSVRRMMD